MSKYYKVTNYRLNYPGLNEEIYELLEKSDRKMEYQQYDLKAERHRIDYTNGIITYIPSREDSYERLLEENRQFAADAESVEEVAVKAVLIKNMQSCVRLLSADEQELIYQLFFNGKTEQEYAEKIGISQKGVNKRKFKILSKLKKMMKI